MASSYFKDRVVQYPGRVTITQVSGNTYDIARAEGTVSQAGTELNAENLNGAIDEANTYTDARTARIAETVTFSLGSLAANAFLNASISIGKNGTKTPIITGLDIAGTGASWFNICAWYVTGDSTNGYTGHVKVRNMNTSAGTMSGNLRVLWVEL